MAEGEWEKPLGLTKEYAITIDDSSDDEVGKSCVVDGADKDLNTTNSTQSLQYYESIINGGISTASVSSYFNSSKSTTSTSKVDNRNCIESCTMSSKTSSNESTDTTTTSDNTQDVSNKSNNNSADDNMADNTKQPSSQDERKVDNTTQNENPFASFAFTSGEASVPSSSSSSSWRSKKKLSSHSKSSCHNNNKQHTKRKNNNNGTSSLSVVTKKAKQPPPHSFFNKCSGSGAEDIIRCKDKKYERQELITKWHKFADPNISIEQQRFQVLVAARLHARCQEPVVLKAMDKLRKYFNEKDEERADNEVQATSQSSAVATKATSRPQKTSGQGLTVHNLANADPETEIAPQLKSVLFANVKSKHIVQASKDILQKFGGRVPESIVSLKSIMGIGPELAGVLNIVNKVDTYTQK